jgi:hypothetical protein
MTYKPPPEMLAEIKRLMRETRRLVEGSSSPFDGALIVVIYTAFMLSAKKYGMTLDQLRTAFGNIWGADDS